MPAAPQSHSNPSFPLHWASLETRKRIQTFWLYTGIAGFSGSQLKGRSMPVRAGVCVSAHRQTRMWARTQAHGKKLPRGEEPDYCASLSAQLRQQSLITLLWGCIMFLCTLLYTRPLSIYYIGAHSHEVGTWKGLQGNRCKQRFELFWQISACLPVSVHTACFFVNLEVTLL